MYTINLFDNFVIPTFPMDAVFGILLQTTEVKNKKYGKPSILMTDKDRKVYATAKTCTNVDTY